MTTPPPIGPDCVAGVLARMLKLRGVDRVFGLCGGHIMPIWMRLDAEGISIVDVRDERAAVYMAHAYSELSGKPGVALVTAGPGVTNAMTGIANAHIARAPVVVISGIAPVPQLHRGALQDIAHTKLVEPITRFARTVFEPDQVPQALDQAFAFAYGDAGGEPGPVFLDFPTDVLRARVSHAVQLLEHLMPKARTEIAVDAETLGRAVKLIQAAKRPLVIGGRGARLAGPELVEFLNTTEVLYLDTGECKGVVPDGHPALVSAMRSAAMGEADLIITIGRKLDFQLGYGSPAVFGHARWIRIADTATELRDNRRGDVEIFATPRVALKALSVACSTHLPACDASWRERLQRGHADRVERLKSGMAKASPGKDGRMHPNRLLHEVQRAVGNDAVIVADGGDFLSFARVGMSCRTYLDPGSFGCIGVGTPFGIGASLALPEQTVAVLTGDGAFGFNAMEIDTAVRHHVPVLIIVANNGAWQIEVHDQSMTHGRVVGTQLRRSDYAGMARSLGAFGERVEDPAQLAGSLQRALAAMRSGQPALLDVQVSEEPMSSDARTGLAWVPDLQALAAWNAAERQWRNKE